MVIDKAGETKIAQYGQWDGYPEGQGSIALDFLHNTNLDEFNDKLASLKFIDEEKQEEINKFCESIGSKDGWMNGEQAAAYHKAYPFLTRDNGAEILNLVMTSEVEEGENLWVHDSTDFAGDSLFCEWAYVIDLSKNTFEVYKGFNQSPIDEDERFFAYFNNPDHRKEPYYPVRKVAEFDLNDLPNETDFCNTFREEEEEV